MSISTLKETIYVPVIDDSVLRGTFDTSAPPFSTVCFRSKEDALNFIQFCKEKYPKANYDLAEYKIEKTSEG